MLFHQEEDRRRAKEEQERQEEEEYLRLKASFIVEEQGEEDQLTEDQVTSSLLALRYVCVVFSFEKSSNIYFLSLQSRSLLKEFIQYIEVRAGTLKHTSLNLENYILNIIDLFKNLFKFLLNNLTYLQFLIDKQPVMCAQ